MKRAADAALRMIDTPPTERLDNLGHGFSEIAQCVPAHCDEPVKAWRLRQQSRSAEPIPWMHREKVRTAPAEIATARQPDRARPVHRVISI
jgi:hypothetical protein